MRIKARAVQLSNLCFCPPYAKLLSGVFDDGSGSLVGTHYRTADISATAERIEAFVVLGCLLTPLESC